MSNKPMAKYYKRALISSMFLMFAVSLLVLPVQPVSSNSEVTIFSEDFEGVFPTDNDWIVADLDSTNDEDYWGASDHRAHSGTYSGWCAQIGERTGWTLIFKEDFEEGFGDGINGWSVGDDNPSGTEAYWDDVNFDFGDEDAASGNFKAYCAGVGYSGSELNPEYTYDMDAYMTRTIDLTGYDQAGVFFFYKMISFDIGFEYGQFLVDGGQVKKYDVEKSDWTVDLTSLNAYVGSTIEIGWNFHSDNLFNDEGWYIDWIVVIGHKTTAASNTESHNYDDFMEAIMQKQIDLSEYASANLSYYYWTDFTYFTSGFDYLYVETSSNGVVWDTQRTYTEESFGWVQDAIDLTEYVGSNVYIRFLFTSNDFYSFFEGAYLDDIEITGTPHDDAGTGSDAGDDFDESAQIGVGTYEGFVMPLDEDDYYKIFVSATNVINITMIPSEFMDFDLALYDPNEDLVDESTNSDDAPENILHTATISGDYFILVHFVSDKPTQYNYTLEISIEDHVPPTLSITSPTNGTEIKSPSVTVTWTGSDADTGIDHYEVKLDDGSWGSVGTDISHTFLSVGDGSHTIHVKAVDGAENSKTALVNFTVNTSILLGPGWMDDILIFAVIAIAIVSIIIVIALVRRRKPKLPPPPPMPT